MKNKKLCDSQIEINKIMEESIKQKEKEYVVQKHVVIKKVDVWCHIKIV